MKRPVYAKGVPHPQPIPDTGVQRRECDIEQEGRDAAREWLWHVQNGRIGGGE